MRTAHAQFTPLSSFSGSNGEEPEGNLTLIGSTLYGTTTEGGTDGEGTVYSMPISGGTPTPLFSFDGSNGEEPLAGLTFDGNNTLYGTTYLGGGTGFSTEGSVFSVPVNGNAPTTLATFNTTGTGSKTGPKSGVTLIGSTLYGTTPAGSSGPGTVFSVPITGGGATVLGTFNGTNGLTPDSGLVVSGTTLYGTTALGGQNSDGTVFSGPVGAGQPTTLASFSASTNGEDPSALSLTLIGTTLYGTTVAGGANGAGTVFSVPVTGGAITTLASFSSSVSGSDAYGTLVLVGSTLYGTAEFGGANNDGTVFSLPLAGGAVTPIVTFDGSNGANPFAGLTADGETLYGTTSAGGTGDGTIFAINLEGIPEPSTWALLLGGLGMLPFWWTRRRGV